MYLASAGLMKHSPDFFLVARESGGNAIESAGPHLRQRCYISRVYVPCLLNSVYKTEDTRNVLIISSDDEF